MSNSRLIQEVEEQMQITDLAYANNIANIDIDRLVVSSVAKKKWCAHVMGTVIEQYLKALILWKGGTWKNLRSVGHGLADLYKLLDADGKKILEEKFGVVKKTQPKGTNRYDYIFKNDMEDSLTDFNNPPVMMSRYLTNGKYDGRVDFPEQSSDSKLNEEEMENLLRNIKVTQYRYSEAPFNLSNNDLRKMYDLARCLHVLSRIARGENASDLKKEEDKIKKR